MNVSRHLSASFSLVLVLVLALVLGSISFYIYSLLKQEKPNRFFTLQSDCIRSTHSAQQKLPFFRIIVQQFFSRTGFA